MVVLPDVNVVALAERIHIYEKSDSKEGFVAFNEVVTIKSLF